MSVEGYYYRRMHAKCNMVIGDRETLLEYNGTRCSAGDLTPRKTNLTLPEKGPNKPQPL